MAESIEVAGVMANRRVDDRQRLCWALEQEQRFSDAQTGVQPRQVVICDHQADFHHHLPNLRRKLFGITCERGRAQGQSVYHEQQIITSQRNLRGEHGGALAEIDPFSLDDTGVITQSTAPKDADRTSRSKKSARGGAL